MKTLAAALIGLVVLLGGCDVSGASTTSTTSGSTTSTTSPTCATNLQATLDKAKTSGTVQLKGCYTTTGTVNVPSNLTIVGNHATLTQVGLGPVTTKTLRPIFKVANDVTLTASDLTLVGPYAGKDGGTGYEGDEGVLLQGSANVDFTDVNVENVQGDFAEFQHGDNNALNTDIVWDNSTFKNAGYHGITLEAVDGLTMEDDHFSNIAVDAVDAEQDIYPTGFNKDGQPIFAAQDTVLFQGDDWTNFGYYLYASYQPQGVQEQNVRLIGNRIYDTRIWSFLGLEGQKSGPARLGLSDFWAVGNTATSPEHSTSGAGTGVAASSISGASDVTIQSNTLPTASGVDALRANSVSGLTVAANDYAGATALLSQYSGMNTTSLCGNQYGPNGDQTDGVCP